jgi:hypothetical protein
MAQRRPIRGHDDYFPILQRHLEQEQYQLIACGANAPTVEEIDSFALQVGARLPFEFVDFSVSRIGGLYVAVKEELWPRPKPYDVGPFWSMLYGMYVYGFAAGIPDFMNIRIQTAAFRQQSGTNLVPCIKIIGDANLYGFDPEGTLFQWDHETGESVPVKKTFLETLEFEIAELAKRKVKKLQGHAGEP